MQAFARVFGRGPRPMLAVHCTLAHAGAWRGVGRALADRVTLTAFDLPGHGKGPPIAEDSDLHDQSVALARTFLTSRMDLIGHSFGATVALRLAVENPDTVRSLTLIEPVLFAVAKTQAPEAFDIHEQLEVPYMAALTEGRTEEAARLFSRRWGDGTRWADFPETTRRYFVERIHLLRAQRAALHDDPAEVLAPGRLEALTMPCLAVQGAQSEPIIDAIHARLSRRIPQLRRVTIEGAGHMSPVTHPEAVSAEIAALLEVAEE